MTAAAVREAVGALVFLALTCLAGATGIAAAERIQRFESDIEVRRDGVLRVAETITVRVEGERIRRGIFRDFPLTGPDAPGGRRRTTFDVVSVTRGGAPEPFQVTRDGAMVRVRIGDPDATLPAPSVQTYEIVYRTDGQLVAYGDYDELYWNVTGADWAFPIERAQVAIRLPEDAPVLQHATYTGPPGARGTNAETTAVGPGLFRAETTAALAPGSGFTVAVAWPPGVVEVSRPGLLFGVPMERIAAVLAALVGVAALLGAWIAVGRDPPRGVVKPEFEPPEGLGPAAIAYVEEMGLTQRAVTAAIVSMAVKGALRIVETGEGGLFGGRRWRLEPEGAAGKPLSAAERAAYAAMFPAGRPLALKADRENGKRMDAARRALREALKAEHYGASFRRNLVWTVGAAAIGLAAAVGLFMVAGPFGPAALAVFLLAALVGGTVLAVLMAAAAAVRRLAAAPGPVAGLRAALPSFGGVIGFAVPLIVGGVILSTGEIGALDPVVLGAGAILGAAAVLFHGLMAAPTRAGRRLLDHIEGFRLYMATAEEDRLGILHPPERTPERFERLLPFAIALGLTHAWSQRFADVLAMHAAPAWYEGGDRFDPARLDSDVGSAVAGTAAPSSGSGGSGGGGASGGGGGGGGGGGW